MGIPAADLPHIFERFRRATNVAGRIAGSGVGLAIARHIIEEHGGTISVESQEGVGTTFTVRLPLTAWPDRSAPPVGPYEAERGQKRSVSAGCGPGVATAHVAQIAIIRRSAS